MDIDYSLATTVTGTVLAYTTEYDPNWKQEDIEANSTKATSLEIIISSEDYEFSTLTDMEGNFTITVPGNLEYVLKAMTTANTYGLGINISPNNSEEVILGSIYLSQLRKIKSQKVKNLLLNGLEEPKVILGLYLTR